MKNCAESAGKQREDHESGAFMNPFFFGPSNAQLYGMYYPPADTMARDKGVIICQSIWQGYIRAHWACTQLAHGLNGIGLHVLLFDYYGTGDSAGKSEEASVRRWQEDIVLAAQELQDIAGIKNYGIIGVRFGAALACKVCFEKKLTPFAMGLWDPVVSGALYLSETVLFHDSLAAAHGYLKPSTAGALIGFPVSPVLRDEIHRFEIREFYSNQQTPYFIAYSEKSPELDVILETSKGGSGFMGACFAPEEGGWLHQETFDKIMLPRTIPEKLVSFFAGRES